MRVTILTDASYCPNTRVAGYGYWIASNRSRKGGMGTMTTVRIISNVVAEAMAVANTLHDGLTQGLIERGDDILMQTDCVAAINAFEGRRAQLSDQETLVVAYVQGMMHEFDLRIRYQHVKGHSRQQGARFVANHMCDKRAKTAMRVARDRVLREGPQQQFNNGEMA